MKAQANILMTGVTGFEMQALLRHLLERGPSKVIAALRSVNGSSRCTGHIVGGITDNTDCSAVFVDQQFVIHSAGTYIVKNEVTDPLAESH